MIVLAYRLYVHVPLTIREARKAGNVDMPTECPLVDVAMIDSPRPTDLERRNPCALCRGDVWRPECTSARRVMFEATRHRPFPIEPLMRVDLKNGVQTRNIISRGPLLRAFWRSIGLLDRSRPSAVHEGIASTTYVLLVMISIAMTHDLGHAQPSSAPQETMLPSSTTAYDGSGDNQSTSIQHWPFDQVATSPCRLRVPDTFPQSPANPTEATTRIGSLGYSPLSARCKFNLSLKQSYSPYTFASAGFQATWAQATGQWPHYGGGTQGWAKRLGATLANTESRRFIQTFALSTILHQEPRYFPSRKRNFGARVWYSTTRVVITKNDNGDNTFNTSELLALCSPVRYKMPTTQDMTGLSGIP